VSLVAGEEVLATDVHLGYAGAQHVDHTYRLPIELRPPGASVILRARVRGGGGTDSAGSLYLWRETP